MKYGVLWVSSIELARGEKKHTINLGDMMQTVSILQLYDSMGIKDDDIIPIDLLHIDEYNGEYVLLPINFNISSNWIVNIFPLPPHIIPVFIGLSFFASSRLTDEQVSYFRQYAPIGCRDESTLELMRRHSIPAFLFGCITLTLKNTKLIEKTNDIILVDAPNEVTRYIPNSLLDGANIVKKEQFCSDQSIIYDLNKTKRFAEETLAQYLSAKLVITSRLHCLSPCLAIGANVIPVVHNISPRMGWIDKYVKIYTTSELELIDWKHVNTCDKAMQDMMRETAKTLIQKAREHTGTIFDISYFYENRVKSLYNSRYYEILHLERCNIEKYSKLAIWGAGQIGQGLFSVIKRELPKKEISCVIDSYVSGDFYGIPIVKPTDVDKFSNCYVFVATTSGKQYAFEWLSKLGREEGTDFVSVASVNG